MRHSEYIEALKSAAIETGKRVLLKKVAEKLPFLFVPLLSPIVTYLLGQIVEILIRETEFAVFLKYTDMRVDAEGRDFSDAVIKNRKAQLSGDPEAKAKAEKELMEKFKVFATIGKNYKEVYREV